MKKNILLCSLVLAFFSTKSFGMDIDPSIELFSTKVLPSAKEGAELRDITESSVSSSLQLFFEEEIDPEDQDTITAFLKSMYPSLKGLIHVSVLSKPKKDAPKPKRNILAPSKPKRHILAPSKPKRKRPSPSKPKRGI